MLDFWQELFAQPDHIKQLQFAGKKEESKKIYTNPDDEVNSLKVNFHVSNENWFILYDTIFALNSFSSFGFVHCT